MRSLGSRLQRKGWASWALWWAISSSTAVMHASSESNIAVLSRWRASFEKTPFDGIHPRGRCRSEMKCPVRVRLEPGMDTGRRVCREGVKDDMDFLRGIKAGGDMIKEGADVPRSDAVVSSGPPLSRSRHPGLRAMSSCRFVDRHVCGSRPVQAGEARAFVSARAPRSASSRPPRAPPRDPAGSWRAPPHPGP